MSWWLRCIAQTTPAAPHNGEVRVGADRGTASGSLLRHLCGREHVGTPGPAHDPLRRRRRSPPDPRPDGAIGRISAGRSALRRLPSVSPAAARLREQRRLGHPGATLASRKCTPSSLTMKSTRDQSCGPRASCARTAVCAHSCACSSVIRAGTKNSVSPAVYRARSRRCRTGAGSPRRARHRPSSRGRPRTLRLPVPARTAPASRVAVGEGRDHRRRELLCGAHQSGAQRRPTRVGLTISGNPRRSTIDAMTAGHPDPGRSRAAASSHVVRTPRSATMPWRWPCRRSVGRPPHHCPHKGTPIASSTSAESRPRR